MNDWDRTDWITFVLFAVIGMLFAKSCGWM